ncbi:hypothetical protein [Legionella shakespearei]|uniref:Coiled-coil protein n=1 Tax=Legionella shakespearei DSM 23087 TaxID=1122169 RepID=A0A0W0Z770_9GAMM|nr:hypothetical protein [Legionella shakespearei]KTD64954.1 hypothetical protein Lsha_0323 [Legionella shakespearei DSM 23087]
MSTDHTDLSQLQSREECLKLLSASSISAMRLRKLGDNHSAYPKQIASLAEVCAHLMTVYSEEPQSIVAKMEESLVTELQKERQFIDSEITTLFERRKRFTANTMYGEKEIVDLTVQISTLERRRSMPMGELVQKVICDTLNQICVDHGSSMLGTIDPDHYEYHDDTVNQSSEQSDPHSITPK